MKAKHVPIAQQPSSDIITSLPQTIIETILCLLPIEEAARTSILSKEWRYKWTKIPKLVFSHYYSFGNMDVGEQLSAINQVMLLRQDPIHEFSLCIDEVVDSCKMDHHSCKMDQIILHLLRNHMVKKFELLFDDDESWYSLPISLFSLHHLTELNLRWCNLNHQPMLINGFGSLTSLALEWVYIPMKTLLHLLSNCPSLKSLSMLMILENFIGDEESTMIELFKCLPVIQHLTIWFEIIRRFVLDLVPQELPFSLIHLKFFRGEQMCFHDGYGLTFLAVVIKNSPNLEKIELEIDTDHILCNDIDDDSDLYEEYHSDVWLEHLSDVWLEHLTELKIKYFTNLEPELEFVKFIIAKSPKLKKVSIKCYFLKDQDMTGMLKTLLRARRASAVVIDVD